MVFRTIINRYYFFFFLLLFIVSGCTSVSCQAQKIEKLETRDFVIEGIESSAFINAEIASTSEQRAQGLMFRTELPDGEGMLFVFERDDFLSFWMKDTLIPLSIAFILSDGRIVEIRDMEPGNLTPIVSSRSVRYALEVPQGWFSRVNITVGDRIILDGL